MKLATIIALSFFLTLGFFFHYWRGEHEIARVSKIDGTIDAIIVAKRDSWNPEGFTLTLHFKDISTETELFTPIVIDNVDLYSDAVTAYGNPSWGKTHISFTTKPNAVNTPPSIPIPQ